MTVDAHLAKLALQAIIRDSEKESIARSTNRLGVLLKKHFGDAIKDQFVFGSHSRGTILPRSMDSYSDVDNMVVFSEGSAQPQTYLDRLRKFAETNYARSEIAQSHPTIALDLNHIRFEIVPATHSIFFGYQIPSKSNDWNKWISTDPHDANSALVAKNQRCDNLAKPLVRLVKYWNAKTGYPYESFELEKMVVAHNFGGFILFEKLTLKKMLFAFIDGIFVEWGATNKKKEAVARAKLIIEETKEHESRGDTQRAVRAINRLLPALS